jgi:hypothetical protein
VSVPALLWGIFLLKLRADQAAFPFGAWVVRVDNEVMPKHASVVVVPLALLAGPPTLSTAQIALVIGMPRGARKNHFRAAAKILVVRDRLQVVSVEAQTHATKMIHDLVFDGFRAVSSFVGGAMS